MTTCYVQFTPTEQMPSRRVWTPLGDVFFCDAITYEVSADVGTRLADDFPENFEIVGAMSSASKKAEPQPVLDKMEPAPQPNKVDDETIAE